MALKIKERGGKWWLYVYWHGQRKKKCIGSKEAGGACEDSPREARLTFGADVIFEPHKKAEPPPAPLLFGEYFGRVARLLREAGVQGIDVEELLARLPPVSEAHLRRKAARRDPPRGRSSLPRRAPRAPAHEEGQGRAETRPRNDQEHLSALRGCLNQAVEDGLLPANPAARLGKLLQAREEIRKQADPLTAEELSAVLAACRDWSTKLGRADTRRWFYPFILALARTGLRLGETVALQWGDLDFHNRSILIRAELHGRSHDDAEERQGARGRDVGRARRRAQGRARDGAAMLDSDKLPAQRVGTAAAQARPPTPPHSRSPSHLRRAPPAGCRSPVWVKDQLGALVDSDHRGRVRQVDSDERSELRGPPRRDRAA